MNLYLQIAIVFLMLSIILLCIVFIIEQQKKPKEMMENVEVPTEYVQVKLEEPTMTQYAQEVLEEQPIGKSMEHLQLNRSPYGKIGYKHLEGTVQRKGELPVYPEAEKMIVDSAPAEPFENKSFLPYEDSVLTNKMSKVQNWSIMARPETDANQQEFGILKSSYNKSDSVGLVFQ